MPVRKIFRSVLALVFAVCACVGDARGDGCFSAADTSVGITKSNGGLSDCFYCSAGTRCIRFDVTWSIDCGSVYYPGGCPACVQVVEYQSTDDVTYYAVATRNMFSAAMLTCQGTKYTGTDDYGRCIAVGLLRAAEVNFYSLGCSNVDENSVPIKTEEVYFNTF